MKVVYRVDDRYMCIRIYKDNDYESIRIESVPLDLINIRESSSIHSKLWENAHWMFLLSGELVQEKTPDGKYFVTDSKGRKEECYLIHGHSESIEYFGDCFLSTLCPINREFRPSDNMLYVLPSETSLWSCGLCEPTHSTKKSVHVLDLFDDIDETHGRCQSKRQKIGDFIKNKVNEIDYQIDTSGDTLIYIGISDHCDCD